MQPASITSELKFKKQPGQILVLVLLVIVVSLAVGLAVASRNLTNLRTSTQAEQSQRAFTAAEGGVEETLSKLNNVAQDIASGSGTTTGCAINPGVDATCALPSSVTSPIGINADTASSNVKVKANKTYEKSVQPGDVAQVNLQTSSGAYSGSFDIDWVKNSDPTTGGGSSMEFGFICNGVCDVSVNGTAQTGPPAVGAYGQHRVAFTTSSGITGQGTGFTANCGAPSAPFTCKTQFSVSNALLLRMKPFWNSVTIKVSATGAQAGDFPVQTYEITSTATTDSGLSRKVQVNRDALPQLPAVFDFALYSGQDIIK